MMKISLILVLAMCTVSHAAPADKSTPTLADKPDPMLAELLAGSNTRFSRQNQEPMSPLSQLLQDALNIPQVALQAVSRLLTNPRNSIGQGTSRSSFNK